MNTAAGSGTPHDNERGRVTINGRQADDGGHCTLIAVHETSDVWTIYPLGPDKPGVRLPPGDVGRIAQVILADTGSTPAR